MRELTREQIEYAVGRLVRLVESRGITQTQLEQASGVNQSTISKIFSGWQEPGADKYSPSEEVLTKLFAAIGLKLNNILNESDRFADHLVGYMATPLTGVSAAADKEIRRVVKMVSDIAAGEEFFAPKFEIYWPGDHTHPKQHADIPAGQVYITDRSRASTHDFVILFCAVPSFGVGQENEIASQSGVPAIRLVPKAISRMMSGSFLMSTDIPFDGSLETGILLDSDKLKNALHQIRETYFRHRALYRGMNGDAFGDRLRKLVDDRCGNYEQFAHDLGISLSYFHSLLEEPFAVSNPSARLLKRMGMRLGERVGYLIGESEETDPIWIESHASWRAWIEKTPGIEAATALRIKDEWRHEYATTRRERLTATSHRSSLKRMTEPDWDKRYQQASNQKKSAASAKPTGDSLFG
jgi:transcriptional regulator with XRE-family HTH domain